MTLSKAFARLLAASLFWALGASGASALEGVFLGLDEASGATLRLEPAEGEDQKGEFTDPSGQTGLFIGTAFPDGVEATFAIGSRTLRLRAFDHPSGAVVVLVPVAPDGALRTDLTQSFGFIREGTPMPETRPYVIPEPDRMGAPVDAAAFVQSYEYWSPEGVSRGYIGVLPKYRSVFALFPALQTDIIWKLCSQPVGAPPGLAEALRGQGVTCADVLGAISNARASGRYTQFKTEVAADRQVAFEAVSCARRVGTEQRCKEIAKLTSQAAVSMENAATVVARYR